MGVKLPQIKRGRPLLRAIYLAFFLFFIQNLQINENNIKIYKIFAYHKIVNNLDIFSIFLAHFNVQIGVTNQVKEHKLIRIFKPFLKSRNQI